MPEPEQDANLSTTSSVVEAKEDATPVASSTTESGAKTPQEEWDSFEPTITPDPATPPVATKDEPVAPPDPAKEPVAPMPSIEGKKEGEVTPTPTDDSKLPFHTHPRWQEVIKERDTLKQATESVKPIVENQKRFDDYLRTNRISDQQLNEALQFLALRNSNPAEAYNRFVKPLATELGKYEGQVLPTDLQEKVDRGLLTPDDARDWAKQRATAEFTQQRSQQDAQYQAEQAEATAILDWETQKRKSDPDYSVKEEELQERHLRLVSLEYARQGIGHPGRPSRLSSSTILQLADQAYADINSRYAKRTPPLKPTTPHLSSTPSPSYTPAPTTWDDDSDILAKYVRA